MNKNIIIIFIDQNLGLYSDYFNTLKINGYSNIHEYSSINESIQYINTLFFKETKIIINGDIFSRFAKAFKENINLIKIIPKIVIYTTDKKEFEEKNQDLKNDLFYKFTDILTSFEDVKKFIEGDSESIKFEIEKEPFLTFEYIDSIEKLSLHLFYKLLISYTDLENIHEFTESLYNDYESVPVLKSLLSPIINKKYIPLELLAKYYARTYTADSNFYRDLNNNLRANKNEKYLPYVKLLYENILLKTFPLVNEKALYRRSIIVKDEIEKINKYLNTKNEELPAGVVYAKTFLSFSKDIKVVEDFMKKNANKDIGDKFEHVLFKLEIKEEIGYDLATFADIEKISFFQEEKEVLFFPFSSFEIIDIKPKKFIGKEINEIDLKYLGIKYLQSIKKYIEEMEEEQRRKEEEKRKKEEEEKKLNEENKNEEKNEIKEEENKIEKEMKIKENLFKIIKIDDYKFAKKITESYLIEKEAFEGITIKELYEKYKKYKKRLKKN